VPWSSCVQYPCPPPPQLSSARLGALGDCTLLHRRCAAVQTVRMERMRGRPPSLAAVPPRRALETERERERERERRERGQVYCSKPTPLAVSDTSRAVERRT
jgi:hypothetical protein